MRIDRTRRARWPGLLAMVFNLCALALVVSLIGVGEVAMGSAASSILQVAGIRPSTSGVAVDSGGQIRYRSRTVTLEDLAVVLKKDLKSGGEASVTILVDAKADSARVAQVLRAAEAAGAEAVRLSTTPE
jgi:biopolymer transport protein ExbD